MTQTATATELAQHTFAPWRVQGDRRIVASERKWREPVKWAQWETGATRDRVLVDADVFEDWPGRMSNSKGGEYWVRPGQDKPATMHDVRRRLFDLIDQAPNLNWLLTTKYLENIGRMMPSAPCPDGRRGCEVLHVRPNLWFGVTASDQASADARIPHLLRVPAAVHVLNLCPLLGPVDLHNLRSNGKWINALDGLIEDPGRRRQSHPRLDLVIVGGETGPDARTMHPRWVRSIRDQCVAAGVPFFFRGWGEWREPLDGESYDTSHGRAQRIPAFIVDKSGIVHCFKNEDTKNKDGRVMLRVGADKSGRMLDGRTWDELPKGGAE